MFKVSQLVGLPLINIYNLKIEGIVEKPYFDATKKSLQYLKIYEENNNTYKLVKFSDIYKITDLMIFVKNSSKVTLYENLSLESELLSNPINTSAINLNGETLGTVIDVLVNKNGQILNISTKNNNYSKEQITSFSSELSLISVNKKINIKQFKPTVRKLPPLVEANKQIEPIVSILNNAPTSPENNYQFLINRKITKDIKNQNGEIIARHNTIISQKTINKLKYYGKLKELMLNSK